MPAFTPIEVDSNTFEIRKIRSWLQTAASLKGKILPLEILTLISFLSNTDDDAPVTTGRELGCQAD